LSSAAPQGKGTTGEPNAPIARRRGPRRAALAGIALIAACPLLLTACSGDPGSKVAIAGTGQSQESLGATPTGGTASATSDPTPSGSSIGSASSTSTASGPTTTASFPGCTAPTPAAWSDLVRESNFSNAASSPSGWNVYSSTSGTLRAASQVKVSSGNLKLTGTTIGGKSVSGGVSDQFSQKYGRWEACMKADRGAGYYPAITLWPDNNDWPAGGELDLIESVDGNRMRNIHFVHNNVGNDRKGVHFTLNLTHWNLFAIDWTPNSVVFWVNGVKQWTMSTKSLVPSRDKMHMTLQFDAVNEPGCHDGCRNASTPKHPVMSIDWTKAFKYTGQKS
jgi:hypothetical protein